MTIDGRALAFALGASVLAGLLFGVAPSLRSVRLPADALHANARGSTGGRDHARTRGALVVMQVALALVLLVSSGLMARTFHALRQIEPGFRTPEHVQIARINIPAPIEPDAAD